MQTEDGKATVENTQAEQENAAKAENAVDATVVENPQGKKKKP